MMQGSTMPRVWTQPLRGLDESTSLGYDMIRFSEKVLGVELLPWEKWLLIHAFEVVGDFDGDWHLRFRTVLLLVARQNGKTMLTSVVTLYFMFMLRVSLVMGVAQELDQADEAWQAVVDIVQENEVLAAQLDTSKRDRGVKMGNGGKVLRLMGNRRYITKAANRKAGRGKRVQLVIIDELREQQSWDAWNSVADTMLAQSVGMVWCTSNAGDSLSVVLRSLRWQAHRALGDPDGWCSQVGDLAGDSPDGMEDDTLAIFEWSAAPSRGLWDRRGWAEANPSLGYGFLTERSLAASIARKTERGARTENLCQTLEATVKSVFPDGSWEAGTDPESQIAPDSPLWWAVDVSADRMHTAVAVCGLRADGAYHVEVVAYRSGLGWLAGWLAERADPANPWRIAYQGKGAPVASMADVFGAVDGVEMVPVTGPDVAGFTGRFWDGVAALDPSKAEDEGSDAVPVYHRPQPVLDLAANVAATRAAGDGAWMWDRQRSAEDISPLVAASTAYGFATWEGQARQAESAYEDDGLMVI